jgi:hypothetical protein
LSRWSSWEPKKASSWRSVSLLVPVASRASPARRESALVENRSNILGH